VPSDRSHHRRVGEHQLALRASHPRHPLGGGARHPREWPLCSATGRSRRWPRL
jgi:hypothetical protein